MTNKKAFEFSFTWLFAIIAGAFIIFSAIYATINLTKAGQYAGNTQLAKQLSIVFNPLETGTASGKSSQVDINIETRVYNKCFTEGSFGSQKFSLSQKSGILKEWPSPGGEISLNNKYVFSSSMEQGKKFYFFSKPFEMPFKVSEIIFLSSGNYCFENAPEFVENEVKSLGLENVKIENCTGKETKVCFNSACNISVYPACEGCENEYDIGYTEKDKRRVYFTGSLIYASIFSDSEIYKCNFKRLMLRTQQIAYLYSSEINFLAGKCGDSMSVSLTALASIAGKADASSSSAIMLLKETADKLDDENSALGGCKLW